MRGLEVIILMVCIAIGFPLVAVMMPVYNDGTGFDTGANDMSVANAFNWSQLEGYQSKSSSPSFIDQASFYIQAAILAVTGIGTLLFSSIGLAPSLLSVFAVNPVLTEVLLSALAIILILSWLQIIKDDDWSGKR